MRAVALIFVAILLGGCTDLYDYFFSPSDEDVARHCGVNAAQLKQMKTVVRKLEPYDGRKVGICTLIKDDTGVVMVGSIEKPPESAK